MRAIMRECFRHLKNESGVALITSLVILVGLTAIGTYAINVTLVEIATSANLKTSKQAFYVAEAGLQHAKAFLNQNKGNWNTYASLDPLPLLAATAFNEIGHYTVTIQDAGGGAAVGGAAAAPGVGTGISLALSAGEALSSLELSTLYVLSVAEVHGVPLDEIERRRTLVLGILLGRAVPFGIGAVIGGAANATVATLAVRAARRAFGPAPESWPEAEPAQP